MAASYVGRALSQRPTSQEQPTPLLPLAHRSCPLLPQPTYYCVPSATYSLLPAIHYVPRPLTWPAIVSSLPRRSSRSHHHPLPRPPVPYPHQDFRGLPNIPLTPPDVPKGLPTPHSHCHSLPLPERTQNKTIGTHLSTADHTHSPKN